MFLGCNNQIENKDHLKSLEHNSPHIIAELNIAEDQKIEMIKEWLIVNDYQEFGLGTSGSYHGVKFSEMVSLDVNSKDLEENIKKFINNNNRRNHVRDSLKQKRTELLARWSREDPRYMKRSQDGRKRMRAKFVEIMKGISSKEDYKAKIPDIFTTCDRLSIDVNGKTRAIDLYSSDEEIQSYIDDLWEDYISPSIKRLKEKYK